MLLLHTSDWHLGHSLYGYDRSDEFEGMLAQITDIVRTWQPDAMIVSGDLYDVAQPSATAQRMFTEAMVAIRNAAPKMTVIVTSGNHDSSSRHETHRELMRQLGIHTVGTIEPDSPDDNIIHVPGIGYIGAVPYVAGKRMPATYYQDLLDRIAELNTDGLPVVLTAHTTVRGSSFEGHDRHDDYMVGGIDYADLDAFGKGYDYLALGHIHKPQWIHGSDKRVRYSGTPIAVSFDEAYAHSVSMVKIDAHGAEAQLETVEIVNPRPLVTLPTKDAAPWSKLLPLINDLPSDTPYYLRLNVEVGADSEPIPSDANILIERACEGRDIKFCLLNRVRRAKVTTPAEAGSTALSVEEFKQINPLDVARRFAEDKGSPLTDEALELLREIISNLDQE